MVTLTMEISVPKGNALVICAAELMGNWRDPSAILRYPLR